MSVQSNNDFFKTNVLGHPAGLFVLFFTEMWERFSYYGMRALLVMFFTASVLGDHPGWGWPREHAMALFGSYTSLVYLSTMLGGYFADKVIGFRWAVILGAFLMTLGHGAMAIETPFFIYTGLTLLVFGTGFFKPNMTSIISHMYKDFPEKKDGAYTIFYMGVNAGAFFGILLCGYLGEKVGWSIGFGLAGIFMLFGLLQFWLSQNIFGDIGLKPIKSKDVVIAEDDTDKRVPFPMWQLVIIGVSSLLGLIWVINDPIAKISLGKVNFLNFSIGNMAGTDLTILFALVLFLFLLFYRLTQYSKITREKLYAVTFFAFFTFVFFAIFEQSPGTLTIFAKDYTNRVLEGNAGMIYKVVNSLITIIPLGLITWVLLKLFKQTFKKYALANIILGCSFVIVWIIAIWMLANDFKSETTEVPASWFSVLNSLFIITLAPMFSKWWESKYNPAANVKFGIGMILLGVSMAILVFGARDIAPGAKVASVSMIWLILVYLFNTMAELCISPVGLSYVSKLVPGRMIAFMFGVWYLAIAIANKVAGMMGESSDKIAEERGISFFFLIITVIAVVVGVIAIAFTPIIKKLMHGVR
ncbi:peptide MFS transporter [Flavobacterium sp. '19STA2R22 D10 B1']|uniref:peptide MFS transporter n=1 Tax=Flavobacterium aerium TaxID=3037261 RepID=UPI00278BDC35|nr:peptide MFS transporter [Flavobacterium sp. '19STA2R22 D10 B1']